jgi:hypothetical protein
MKKQNETNKNKNTNFFSSLRVKKGTKDNALKILDTINKGSRNLVVGES